MPYRVLPPGAGIPAVFYRVLPLGAGIPAMLYRGLLPKHRIPAAVQGESKGTAEEAGGSFLGGVTRR